MYTKRNKTNFGHFYAKNEKFSEQLIRTPENRYSMPIFRYFSKPNQFFILIQILKLIANLWLFIFRLPQRVYLQFEWRESLSEIGHTSMKKELAIGIALVTSKSFIWTNFFLHLMRVCMLVRKRKSLRHQLQKNRKYHRCTSQCHRNIIIIIIFRPPFLESNAFKPFSTSVSFYKYRDNKGRCESHTAKMMVSRVRIIYTWMLKICSRFLSSLSSSVSSLPPLSLAGIIVIIINCCAARWCRERKCFNATVTCAFLYGSVGYAVRKPTLSEETMKEI